MQIGSVGLCSLCSWRFEDLLTWFLVYDIKALDFGILRIRVLCCCNRMVWDMVIHHLHGCFTFL